MSMVVSGNAVIKKVREAVKRGNNKKNTDFLLTNLCHESNNLPLIAPGANVIIITSDFQDPGNLERIKKTGTTVAFVERAFLEEAFCEAVGVTSSFCDGGRGVE